MVLQNLTSHHQHSKYCFRATHAYPAQKSSERYRSLPLCTYLIWNLHTFLTTRTKIPVITAQFGSLNISDNENFISLIWTIHVVDLYEFCFQGAEGCIVAVLGSVFDTEIVAKLSNVGWSSWNGGWDLEIFSFNWACNISVAGIVRGCSRDLRSSVQHNITWQNL